MKFSFSFPADKALRRAILGVYEDDVLWVASGRIEGKKDHRPFEDFGQSMNDAPLEEEEVAWSELSYVRVRSHPERAPSRKNIEIFVRAPMVMRRCFTIDAEDPGARGFFIG
jgi:hypothetical protein